MEAPAMIDRPLHVAMVIPPWFELPPQGYGGIESMCADLVHGLVERGQRVTLVGTGRNGTEAAFVRTYHRPQGDRLGEALPEVVHAAALPSILASLDADVVHDHSLAGPLLASAHRLPTVVTAHGPVSGEMGEYYRHLGGMVALVAISDAQRRAAPWLNWSATVHNAVRTETYPFRRRKHDFVLFLGRLAPAKGLPEAIAAAASAGLRLVIAAKCREPEEHDYLCRVVKPLLVGEIDWLGEVDGSRKRELLSQARCLLFPIQWEEPFGMVMIEAMACGTPVVALRRGSVPEIVEHGETGLICDDPAELPAALHRVHELDPVLCRRRVEDRFDAQSMAESYERLYRAITRADVAPARAS
jgi:glycosyltransferase involved in cell wall biosynthesis